MADSQDKSCPPEAHAKEDLMQSTQLDNYDIRCISLYRWLHTSPSEQMASPTVHAGTWAAYQHVDTGERTAARNGRMQLYGVIGRCMTQQREVKSMRA